MDQRSGSKVKPSGPSRRRVLARQPRHLPSRHPKKLGGSSGRWPSPFFLRSHFSAMDGAHHVPFLGAQNSSSVTWRILGIERKYRHAACLCALKQQSLEAQPYNTRSFLFKPQEVLGRNCVYWACLAVPPSPRFFFFFLVNISLAKRFVFLLISFIPELPF